jgi:integrase
MLFMVKIYVINIITIYGNFNVIQSTIEVPELHPIVLLPRFGLRREDPAGLVGVVAEMAVILYAHTGTRPSELRHAKLEDLDVNTLTLHVSCPKGRTIYGDDRNIDIDEMYRERILAYLETRAVYLHGADCDALFPYRYAHGRYDEWTQGLWTKLKQAIQQQIPFKWSWKTLRASCANIDINTYGVSIQDEKVKLGHNSTTTTETYYAQINEGRAHERISERLSETKRLGKPLIGN